MTPARLAEIRAYINRLDLDQLPGWTVEQRIIADLYAEMQAAEPTFYNVEGLIHLEWPGEPRPVTVSPELLIEIVAQLNELRDIKGNPYRDRADVS